MGGVFLRPLKSFKNADGREGEDENVEGYTVDVNTLRALRAGSTSFSTSSRRSGRLK